SHSSSTRPRRPVTARKKVAATGAATTTDCRANGRVPRYSYAMGRMQFPTKQPMPGNVRAALEKRDLMEAYFARPSYQQDDYLKWIALAVGPAAKQKRLDQMLEDLEKGNAYKGEPWAPAEKPPRK